MKKFLITTFVVILICFVGLWSVISGGYDRQNKTILLLKEFIPNKLAKKVRDIIFIIPDLKEQNKIYKLQVAKYEQGYEGNLFEEIKDKSEDGTYVYSLKKFFLPFPRLDTRLGWQAKKNSKRAHYLEIVEDQILVISGLGETIYFDKKNFYKKKLNQKIINNNIEQILKNKNSELLGISLYAVSAKYNKIGSDS